MYEVYALKYGERDTKTCQFFYRDDKHDPLTLHYFVWLILGGPHPVLVDTGFLEDDAEARGIRNYVRPSTVVEKVAGVKANAIPMALISHLHYDHWAGHSLFPNAEYWVQKDEVAFWTGPYAGKPAFRGSANVEQLSKLVPLNYGTKLKIIDGDREVLPGITCHRVGGHTAGLQIVSVKTKNGTVVLTSDASHFYRNDLAFAANPAIPKNPHTFLTGVLGAATAGIALEAQQQIATFFASEVVPGFPPTVIDPDALGLFPVAVFEVPVVLPLPETLNFIP